MAEVCVVLVTCDSQSLAETIAQYLVEQKLAACVNILPHIKSIYSWEGKIERSDELLLVIKTRGELFGALSAAVKEKHTYDCPEIIALPVKQGYPPYLNWIENSVLVR